MMSESFLRDFFGMRPASKPEPAKQEAVEPRVITVECHASDPIEIRAENIVKLIGFQGGDGGYSIPRISPAEATLCAIKVLRRYAEQDAAATSSSSAAGGEAAPPTP